MFGLAVAKRRLRGLQPDAGFFYPVDAIELAREMKLAERGQDRGKLGLPDSGTKVFDDIEQEVLNRISIETAEARTEMMSQLGTYEERLESIKNGGEATDFKTLAREAETAFAATIREAKNDLHLARRRVTDSKRDLISFRAENKLERAAHVANSFISIAILNVLLAIETIPSAKFLGENDALGLLGGWIQAVAFSALNLSLSLMIGFFGWRFLNHKKIHMKVMGAAITTFLTGVVISFNLLLAHFRTASQTLDQKVAAEKALDILRETPFALDDVTSTTMVGLGLIIAFAAMIKGFMWDDRYFGYGHYWRARDKAELNYKKVAREKMNHLRDEQDDFVADIRAARSSLRDKRNALPVILQQRRRLVDAYYEHLKHIEQVAQTLLSVYRESNCAVRGVNAPPVHFQEAWKMEKPEKITLPEPDFTLVDMNIAAIDRALEESIATLHKAFDDTILWVEHIGEIEQEMDLNEPAIQNKRAA